ncbi:MAG: AAA family ATPase [Polyangiaceae bacterium]|nr:AAA family ATPase [Polyangiaceae bacterium]
MSSALPRFVEHSDLENIPYTGLRGQYGPYLADEGLVHAARTALGLNLPLLLTGEPGCGKSDFAWVAAHAIGRAEPLRCHIRSDTKARDLLYHYDALTRFGDAQHGDRERARDPRKYIALRPLGAALMSPGPRNVILLDEIDKAPRDLPNDLLHELDEGRFEIPEIGDFVGEERAMDRTYKNVPLQRNMERPEGQKRPLVVITSNAERQLPEPFLRRCVFFHIPPPTETRLAEIAKARFPDGDLQMMLRLSSIFMALRAERGIAKPPTTAEMLNWVDALHRLYNPADVEPTVRAFAGGIVGAGGKLPDGMSWGDLPGLPCLLKLNEDLDAIGARDR